MTRLSLFSGTPVSWKIPKGSQRGSRGLSAAIPPESWSPPSLHPEGVPADAKECLGLENGCDPVGIGKMNDANSGGIAKAQPPAALLESFQDSFLGKPEVILQRATP